MLRHLRNDPLGAKGVGFCPEMGEIGSVIPMMICRGRVMHGRTKLVKGRKGNSSLSRRGRFFAPWNDLLRGVKETQRSAECLRLEVDAPSLSE